VRARVAITIDQRVGEQLTIWDELPILKMAGLNTCRILCAWLAASR
jgi:hypothetical protein